MIRSISTLNSVSFPAQKKGLTQKTKKWQMDCIDAGEYMAVYSEHTLRQSYVNKKINYDLYSDIVQEEDMKRIADPYKLGLQYSPVKIQNYPLVNPKIDVLIGEERKRFFDWRLKIVNPDILQEKKLAEFDEFRKFILKLAQEDLPEHELKEQIGKFHKYMKFTRKDFREMYGTHIIKHLEQKEQFKIKFNQGFKDALISSEEIYQWDIISNEPRLFKLNPLNVHTVLSGESNYIEDSDIIVIDGYKSPGQIQDEYFEFLTQKEIDLIEEASLGYSASFGGSDPGPMLDPKEIAIIEDNLDSAAFNTKFNPSLSPIDNNGNLRVVKVYWKSRRKLLKVTSYSPLGEEIKEIRPEFYKLKPGETAEVLWVNEWWEGHKICLPNQKAIYTKIRIKPVQYRSMLNLSIAYPGIIGTIYTTNNQRALSFMDKGKPYQYLYNVVMNNIENLIATNWGKILKVPLHEVPDGWDIDKWIAYAKTFKAVPTDLFKEGKKGAAIGKISGGLQQNTPVIDMEVGQSLNMYVQLAGLIEQKIGNVLGVTRAREGQISASELVGNTERQIVQSNHITEYYFMEHDYLKARVMLAGLLTAKLAWKGTKKLEVVLDDFTSQLVEVNIDQINPIEWDITIDSSTKTMKIDNAIEQLAHAGFQNGMLNFATFIDILQTDSIAERKRKLELLQDQAKEEQQKAAQAQAEAEQKKIQEERAFQKELITLKENKATERELIRIQAKTEDQDLDNDGINDYTELDKERIKAQAQEKQLRMKLEHESKEKEKDRKLEEKKISIEEKKIKQKK